MEVRAVDGCAEPEPVLERIDDSFERVKVSAVLASLYPVVTVLLAAAVLHEKVARMQRVGIVLTLTGVVLISV